MFNIWRGTAFSMMLFAAALQIRAAVAAGDRADGRRRRAWQQLRDVVFPHIRGHVLTNTLLISLWTFNDFTPYLLTAGGPTTATEILPVFIYNDAIFEGGQLGYGAAISLIMLVINLVIALVYLRLLTEARGSRERSAAPAAGHRACRPPDQLRRSAGARSFTRRVLFYVLIAVVTAFFALPMLWLAARPVRRHPAADRQDARLFTLDNFRDPVRQPLRACGRC